MHHDTPGTDLNPIRGGVQIDTFIQIDTVTEFDLVCKPQADAALDRGKAIHTQDQAIKQPSHSHANNGGDPPKQEVQNLFENISEERRCLTVKIEADSVQHSLESHLFDDFDARIFDCYF
jgi:hypothetical protein